MEDTDAPIALLPFPLEKWARTSLIAPCNGVNSAIEEGGVDLSDVFLDSTVLLELPTGDRVQQFRWNRVY